MKSFTSSEIEAGTRILLLPLGAWEQHGPHLPLQTDSLIIEKVVEHALNNAELHADEFVVAPTMSITASDEHDDFVGGLSCGTEALVASVVAIARSAWWARGVCIVNGHGGNADALGQISSALSYEKIRATVWSLPAYKGGDFHAGHTETSLLLYLFPELVRMHAIEPGKEHLTTQDVDTMRTHGIRAVSPNGILGDPRRASAEHGKEVLDFYCTSLATTLHTCVTTWTTSTTQ